MRKDRCPETIAQRQEIIDEVCRRKEELLQAFDSQSTALSYDIVAIERFKERRDPTPVSKVLKRDCFPFEKIKMDYENGWRCCANRVELFIKLGLSEFYAIGDPSRTNVWYSLCCRACGTTERRMTLARKLFPRKIGVCEETGRYFKWSQDFWDYDGDRVVLSQKWKEYIDPTKGSGRSPDEGCGCSLLHLFITKAA